MAGRSIDEARTAQRAASGKSLRVEQLRSVTQPPSNANVATLDTKTAATSPLTAPESIVISGVTYYPGS